MQNYEEIGKWRKKKGYFFDNQMLGPFFLIKDRFIKMHIYEKKSGSRSWCN